MASSQKPTKFNGIEILNRLTNTKVDAAIVLPELSSAPTVTTNKLYNHNGVLYFDGANLESGGGGGPGGSLNDAYENGAQITVDAGAIELVDASTSTLNTLALSKDGAGSGNVIDIDMNLGIAAQAIYIDNGAGARTGSDIRVKADSTGAHSVIDIDAEGSGAIVGFDFTGSYNGSPSGHAIKVTFDDNDALNTEVMQIDSGAGARGIMFDFNFGHTDSGTTSHIWDIDVTGVIDSDIFNYATSSACTGNVFFIDLDNGVAQTAFHVEGSGVRTQPMIELATDATGSANLVTFVVTGAISGNVLDFQMDTTSTGNVLDIDMNASVGGKAIYLDSGNAVRTAVLVDILADGSGNADCFNIDESNTGSGMLFDINVSGIGSGNVIDITYSAADTGDAIKVVMANNVAGGALVITGAGVRTDQLIEVTTSETGSVDGIMRMDATGIFTGSVLTLTSSGAATTGSLLHLDLDAGVAYKAMTIDMAGARTAATILLTMDGSQSSAGGTFLDANITMTGASSTPWMDIDVTGVYTGNIFDVLLGAVAATGDVISIDLGATATTSQAIVLASGAMARSTALVQITDAGTNSGGIIFDINSTGVRSAVVFDIDDTAATTGNIFDYATSAASTGTIFAVNMTNAVGAKGSLWTTAGTRTENLFTFTDSQAGAVDLFQMDVASTSSGMVFDVNVTGNFTGNVLDIVYSVSAVTGDAISIAMGTNVAGSAIVLTGAGARTDDMIKIDDSSSTNASVFDINLSGAFTSEYAFALDAIGAHNSGLMQLRSDSNDSGGRPLLNVINDNTAATGTTPLRLQQDAATSTNYFKLAQFVQGAGTVTLWMGNGTTAQGNLSGTAGDIIFNAGSNKPEYCTGTTNWTALV